MSNIGITVKKGRDLRLMGAVGSPSRIQDRAVSVVAVTPDDFPGFTPKPEVKEGDAVKCGQPLLRDKNHPEIKLASPVTGTVRGIVRGERRKILRVEVEVADSSSLAAMTKDPVCHKVDMPDAAQAKEMLTGSGLWAMMRQRPYDVVVNPDAELRDIFVTGFDSAPLAVNPSEFNADQIASMEAGVALLRKLTPGDVYVTRSEWQKLPDLRGASMITVSGPHPSGNIGTAIGMVKPVNKGETVATLSLDVLIKIGQLATTGVARTDTIVAVTGSEAKEPKLLHTVAGASLRELLAGEIKGADHHQRIISGNVLTGYAETLDGYLRAPYHQVTIIPEGDDVAEFMGWASLSPNKMSSSHSFLSAFLPGKKFNPDARILGGRRAMIMSGEYDKVIPLDIMPEFLIKAILARDIDRMEALGIYEVAPEDFALAEYGDTSKLELQKIVREGLDYLKKELE